MGLNRGLNMALTGEKKKEYQRKYMREYMRKKRHPSYPRYTEQFIGYIDGKPQKVKTLLPVADADGNPIWE